ncbi:hypothetical protein AHF37_00143, partial [Paragonimus kellicotti]
NLARDVLNPVCQSCVKRHGTCYRSVKLGSRIQNSKSHQQTLFKTVNNGKDSNIETYGCSCSVPSANPLVQPDALHQHQFRWGPTKTDQLPRTTKVDVTFCSAQLVDIGSYCNQMDVICRSRYATCSIPNSFSRQFSACECLTGLIPVYQRHLKYHECFPLVRTEYPACLDCSKAGGLCYWEDIRKPHAVKCLCPSTNNLRPGQGGQQKANSDTTKKCPNKLDITCSQGTLKICYQPPSIHDSNFWTGVHTPYETAVVISDLPEAQTNSACIIHESGSGLNSLHGGEIPGSPNIKSRWCQTFFIETDLETPNCGIKRSVTWNNASYEGNVTVFTSSSFRSRLQSEKFAFYCSAPKFNKINGTSIAHVRAMPHNMPAYYQDWRWKRSEVEFSVQDTSGRAVSRASMKSILHLKAYLNKNLGNYKYLNIERCDILPTTKTPFADAVGFIDKGCPVYSSGFTVSFLPDYPDADLHGNTYMRSSSFSASTLITPGQHGNDVLIADEDSSDYGAYIISDDEQSLKLEEMPQSPEKHRAEFINNSHTVNLPQAVLELSTAPTKKKSSLPLGSLEYELQISCVFRLCHQASWCTWPAVCDSFHEIRRRTSMEYQPDSLKFLHKVVKLTLYNHTRKSRQNTKTSGELTLKQLDNTFTDLSPGHLRKFNWFRTLTHELRSDQFFCVDYSGVYSFYSLAQVAHTKNWKITTVQNPF